MIVVGGSGGGGCDDGWVGINKEGNWCIDGDGDFYLDIRDKCCDFMLLFLYILVYGLLFVYVFFVSDYFIINCHDIYI